MKVNRYLSTTEDSVITVVPFGDYDTLPKEFTIIYEDAYGDRKVKIVNSDELESELTHYSPLPEKTT